MLGRTVRGVLGFTWRLLDGLRRTVHLFLMLLVLAAVLAALASRPARLPESFVLVVGPEGVLVEQYSGHPIERAIEAAQGRTREQTLVGDLVEALDEAAGDQRVKAVHLDLDVLVGGSIDKLARVAEALDRFRDTGRPVIASGTGFGHPQYYLGAHADELYLDPLGGVILQGFSYYRYYFRSALEKLSVDWYVFDAGEAKSFGEPYVRDDMSEAARADLEPVVEGLWEEWRADVAHARGIEPALIDDYIERLLPRLRAAGGDIARMALDAGLVDGIAAIDELEQRLVETGAHDRRGNLISVDAEAYLAARRVKTRRTTARGERTPAVGLIVARGDILPGEQPPGTIGDHTLRELLREARDDKAIHALVLRVDSGGGSQLASEAIMRELMLVRESGKPVLVSMGGVAASGGYLLALGADEIWAHPTTVTGSIGVVAMVPNFGRLLNRLGVSVDGFGTHRFAGDFRLDRPFSEEARQFIEMMVEGSYERFMGQVAQARGLPDDEVRQLAEGRTWLGTAAQAAGLVDELGTLEEALAAAAGYAGLDEDFRVALIEPRLSFGQRLMVSLLSGSARLGLPAWPRAWLHGLPGELRTLINEVERLDGFADPRGLYYHCFCDVW